MFGSGWDPIGIPLACNSRGSGCACNCSRVSITCLRLQARENGPFVSLESGTREKDASERGTCSESAGMLSEP